METNID